MNVNSKMTAIADEIRELSGATGKIGLDAMATNVRAANTEINTQTGLISQIQIALEGKAVGGSPDPVLQDKTVTPSTSSQTVTADSGYDGLDTVTVEAILTTTQATPSISVSSDGLITASVTQTSGYVDSGTKNATKQLTTQPAKTITPTKSTQTAVASGQYTTGAVMVDAIPDEYITTSDATATSSDILKDKSAYANGEKLIGNFTIDNEVSTQEGLIAQIQTALEGKSAGGSGGGSTETVQLTLAGAFGSVAGLFKTDAGTIFSAVMGTTNPIIKGSVVRLPYSGFPIVVTPSSAAEIVEDSSSYQYYKINADCTITMDD